MLDIIALIAWVAVILFFVVLFIGNEWIDTHDKDMPDYGDWGSSVLFIIGFILLFGFLILNY